MCADDGRITDYTLSLYTQIPKRIIHEKYLWKTTSTSNLRVKYY